MRHVPVRRSDSTPSRSLIRNLPRLPPAAILRVMVLAALAVAACVWAIVHALSREPRGHGKTTLPAEAPSEIPAPESIPSP